MSTSRRLGVLRERRSGEDVQLLAGDPVEGRLVHSEVLGENGLGCVAEPVGQLFEVMNKIKV